MCWARGFDFLCCLFFHLYTQDSRHTELLWPHLWFCVGFFLSSLSMDEESQRKDFQAVFHSGWESRVTVFKPEAISKFRVWITMDSSTSEHTILTFVIFCVLWVFSFSPLCLIRFFFLVWFYLLFPVCSRREIIWVSVGHYAVNKRKQCKYFTKFCRQRK